MINLFQLTSIEFQKLNFRNLPHELLIIHEAFHFISPSPGIAQMVPYLVMVQKD